jgi:hypothetical protein
MRKALSMKWLLLILLFPLTASSQDLRFLECARVAFFEPACPAEVPARPAPPPPPAPLFPPETVARDMPPLLLTLLDTPTRENAQHFLDWQAQRTQRILEVQRLLQSLTRSPHAKEP